MKRLIWSLALATAALTAACGDNPAGARNGGTRFLLTDAPFPYDQVARVDVHIVRIEASVTGDTTGTSSGWSLIAEPRRTVNLLELQNGSTTILGEHAIPADQYSAVRLVMDTRLSSVTKHDGSAMPVHWQGSGEIQLHAQVPHLLASWVEGTERSIVIDFDVGRSFVPWSGGSLLFMPWIRAVVDIETGTIEGTVRSAAGATVANASIEVVPDVGLQPYPPVLASGRSGSDGRFRISYVSGGTYDLVVTTAAGACVIVENVAVTMGEVAVADATFPNVISCTSPNPHPDTTGNPPPPPPPPIDTGTGGVPSGPVAAITVSPAAQTVNPGDSLGVYAMLLNAQGQLLAGRTVTFSSSNTAVVNVTHVYGPSALLRGVASGSATITATAEGVSGTATVTVR